MNHKTLLASLFSAALLLSAGCGKEETPRSKQESEAEQKIRQKHGKPLAKLPGVKLVAISPHNESIQDEYERAFRLHHAMASGRRVDIEWRDVGGGTTAILRYLRGVYKEKDTSGIDIVWGGGDQTFVDMASAGFLQPMELSQDILANIPERFGGVRMYDENRRWCGAAVSAFGFIYSRRLLGLRKLTPPTSWDDLGSPAYFDAVCLADPMQSGAAATTYEIIAQSAPTWAEGWAKLLSILGNAKKFFDSSGAAAAAPGLGEAAVATCIDFYGTTRVFEAPGDLVYASPRGQTAFNPDPIGILKGAPNGDLAQDFVDFVLSARGQALWALKAGEQHGPTRAALGRQPIRRDVYGAYAGKFCSWIVDPYQSDNEFTLDVVMAKLRFDVLKPLVRAAAITNRTGLRAARKKLIETNFDAALLADFNRLPDNVATPAGLSAVAQLLKNPTKAERITSGWATFFREKYKRIAR